MTPEERITKALGQMPYLPMSSYYSTKADPESLADTLESFADALARIARENHETETAYNALRADVAAMRRVLSIAGGADSDA